MRNLSVEDSSAVDLMLLNQGCSVLAKIMKDFDHRHILEQLFQTEGEGIYLHQVKNVASLTNSNL